MSWASRRRVLYLAGVFLVIAAALGIPLYRYLHKPATCADGVLNQGETAVDRGGPCQILDERALVPQAVQWARSFSVRDGSANAVAYIENPNESAGVARVPYRFKLYDDQNVLVAERGGATFVMPGAVTPVFEGDIPTGSRRVSRTFFEFAAPLVWERLFDSSDAIKVADKEISDTATAPRVRAEARNTSVADMKNVEFVAVVFNSAGNAFAASKTIVPDIAAGERREIVFTWPSPFEEIVGRIDVIPLSAPRRPR